ncbi:MAG TPA: TonB-dependent receptor [Acidobacteriaceae bacterium]|nr:TonB-dependent receptor [Acidobacteriaceae bacterium]
MFKSSAGKALRLLLALLCVATCVLSSSAQSSRGAMAGNVTDQTGAVISGAVVTVTNQATGGKSQTTSTSAGSYRFPDLPIGNYTVTATAPGFSTATNTGVLVQVNITTGLDVKLQPGAVTETVTVDASGLRLETESADIGGTVSNKQIEDLPLSLASGVGGLRSPETFVFLLPGTTGPGSGTGGNSGNGVFFSRLSGGQAYGNEVLLDGASIQRSENGSSFDETSPSIEALQEFKVTTSTPSAEFGRTTSGIESFSTKQGTNVFHGIAYALVKNRIFDANNWFNNGYKAMDCQTLSEVQCPYSKGQDSKYDFGGVFDGPMRLPHLYNGTDRSFFLFAWEKYQLHQGGVTQSTVPTAAERTGNFQDVLGSAASPVPGGTTVPGYKYPVLVNPCTGQPVLYNQIFDPSTSVQISPGIFCRTPFQNNTIPTARLSAAALKLLNGLPLPNQAPTNTDVSGYINNYSFAGVAPNTNTTYTIRIDQNLSDRNKIFASYSTRQNFKLTAAPDFPEPFNNAGYVQTFTTHYSRAGWDFTITPRLLNHVNLGYNRTNSVNLSPELGSSLTAASAGVANDYSSFYPVLTFPSPDQPSSLGQQQNGTNIDNGIRLNDIVSWQKGRNSLRFGVDVRFQQYSVINYNNDSFNFYRDQSAAVSNACCGSGNPVASFLLGEVGYGQQTVYNEHQRWNSHYLGGFVQDDVKLTNNLTVNVGLRYDVDAPRHEALNRTSDFSLTAPDAAAGGLPGALVFATNCNCNTAWANTWFKDIAPRLGFAYVLPGTDNKAVLRGGGAIIYGPLQYNDFGGDMVTGYNQFRSFSQGQTATTGGAFTPAFQLDASTPPDPTNPTIGFPNVSYAPNLDPDQLSNPNGPGNFQAVAGELILPNDGRPSMTSNWSLQLQDQVAQDLIFTMGYIGQVAQNLRSGFLTNFNNIPTSAFGLGDQLTYPTYNVPLGGASSTGVKAPYSNFTGALGQALRPFPQYDYIADDCCLENLGHSSYNAMVVSLERRFRNGLNLQASYTWSKTLTDADSAIPFSYTNNNEREQAANSTNLKQDKAVSVQDLRHQFSLSYLYQLPFGKGRKFLNDNRALDLLIGGWEVGAIQRYASGQPIDFGCATGIPYYQNCITYTAGPTSNGGTDFASDAYKANKNGPSAFNGQSWFKPAYRVPGTNGGNDPGVPLAGAAFYDQNREGSGWARPFSPNCGTSTSPCSLTPFSFGNIPRITEAVTGPLYLAEDVSLLKDFHITERVNFQLKGEAFDVFNRHRMGLPDLQPGDSANLTTGFGIPGGVDYGPRQMQVTGKVIF